MAENLILNEFKLIYTLVEAFISRKTNQLKCSDWVEPNFI